LHFQAKPYGLSILYWEDTRPCSTLPWAMANCACSKQRARSVPSLSVCASSTA